MHKLGFFDASVGYDRQEESWPCGIIGLLFLGLFLASVVGSVRQKTACVPCGIMNHGRIVSGVFSVG